MSLSLFPFYLLASHLVNNRAEGSLIVPDLIISVSARQLVELCLVGLVKKISLASYPALGMPTNRKRTERRENEVKIEIIT